MKIVRTAMGPFSERPIFTSSDIENVCETELIKADLYPAKPEPVRMERLIEKRFGITVEYLDLPASVLGYTLFGSKGVEGIVVSRALGESDSAVARRRVRTTLAHEAGHGFLHAYLYGLADKSDIFSVSADGFGERQKILCRDGANGWAEIQANMAIGSLLLPEAILREGVSAYLDADGKKLRGDMRGKAAQLLSDVFDVNPVVARIRLDGLFPV